MFARTNVPAARRSHRRTGFALPMAILVLALMTAAIVAAFSATSAEVIANSARRAQDHAYQLAESGLQKFVQQRGSSGFACSHCVVDPTAAVDSEWTRIGTSHGLVGGYADVVAMQVRPQLSDGSPAIFFIRSTGVDTTVKMSGAGIAVYATRTIGQYATFATSGIKPLGAFTSLRGVTFSNPTGPNAYNFDGRNESSCSGSDKSGVVIPGAGQYRRLGNSTQPEGASPEVDSSLSFDSLKARVGIDWNAIVNYDAIPADITIPGGSWPSWIYFLSPSYYPVIRVKTNNYTIPNMGLFGGGNGRGLIIADSNLILSGNNNWHGIILVGGRLVATGSPANPSYGVFVTGLNAALPGATPPIANDAADNDSIVATSTSGQNDSRQFRYSLCEAAEAASQLRWYFAWHNTWSDNIATW